MSRKALLVALVAGLTLPAATAAQGGPGFMFENPRLSLSFRTGYQLPQLGSDIFEFPLDSLTLARSDFASPWLGAEIGIRVTDRLDIAAGLGWTRARSASEYVNWLEGGAPIQQVTTFQTINATLGAKYYFTDRGRSIGRFAWVPSRFTPYVGGGIGVVDYQFVQEGDFVDFESIVVDPIDGSVSADIFTDHLRTTGTGFAGYVAGGLDVTLGRQFVLTGEGRYTLSSAPVDGPFSEFDSIDLAGLQLLVGIGFRF